MIWCAATTTTTTSLQWWWWWCCRCCDIWKLIVIYQIHQQMRHEWNENLIADQFSNHRSQRLRRLMYWCQMSDCLQSKSFCILPSCRSPSSSLVVAGRQIIIDDIFIDSALTWESHKDGNWMLLWHWRRWTINWLIIHYRLWVFFIDKQQ